MNKKISSNEPVSQIAKHKTDQKILITIIVFLVLSIAWTHYEYEKTNYATIFIPGVSGVVTSQISETHEVGNNPNLTSTLHKTYIKTREGREILVLSLDSLAVTAGDSVALTSRIHKLNQ